jgi:hypothetical protein
MKKFLKPIIPALLCLFAAAGLHAQTITLTYQGRVTSGGTPFTGVGQFKFVLVTSTDASATATATASLTAGFVTSIAVNSPGSGYASPPAVTISGGGGSGATATATVSGGGVTIIAVNNAGSGYTSPPTVSIAPPPSSLSYVTHWSNDGTSVNGSQPAAAVSVPVTSGLFTVALGDTSLANMAVLGSSLVALHENMIRLLQMRIWFNDGVNGFAALDPVQKLTEAPYASYAHFAGSLAGQLPDGRLSANVALRGGGNAFSGEQSVSDGILATKLNGNEINFTRNNGPAYIRAENPGGRINFITDGRGQSDANANLILNTDMSSTFNGSVGIGTTSPGFLLHVNGSAGKPGGGSWSVASDERLKRNIRPLAGALDKLLSLHGVNFEYKEPEKIGELSGERTGLIAQEVEKVFPDWVETAPDGYKRVTVRGLEALVVEALRQLRAEKDSEVDQLKRSVAELKALMAEKAGRQEGGAQ